ncbi:MULTISPECIES: NUDIX domain-containing protein [unclassified Pseudomonas]|uniref:NUDIX hydrolase n=1 Tax=unclassified Pseudomonas TaxID=196821 RepID=UPI001F593FB0|nr:MULTISPECIES: NUDIX domain-containing protein [unclassified Pseudomonas]
MVIAKACPVVLRKKQTLEILAFEHPLAGFQLVKGSVEPGETTETAAIRELREESGITGSVIRGLGTWYSEITGHTWAFHQCQASVELADTWTHFAEDDGGHEFRFFWHPLSSELTPEWHPIFKGALTTLIERLGDNES